MIMMQNHTGIDEFLSETHVASTSECERHPGQKVQPCQTIVIPPAIET